MKIEIATYFKITALNIIILILIYACIYLVNLFLYDWEFVGRKKLGLCNKLVNNYTFTCPQMRHFSFYLNAANEKTGKDQSGYLEIVAPNGADLKVPFSLRESTTIPILFFVEDGNNWLDRFAILFKGETKYKLNIVFNNSPPEDMSLFIRGWYRKKDAKSFEQNLLIPVRPIPQLVPKNQRVGEQRVSMDY